MEVRSDRRFHFDADPARFWSAIGSVEDYPRWWPWLRSFEAKGMVQGDEWRCTVKPPLPYVVRFTIHLEEVDPEVRVRARVSGDIEGTALLDVEPDGDGCAVQLVSALQPTNAVLKVMATFGRPLARFGHDWVLDIGAGQFASRAL
jgi:hypothetical protein